MSGTPVSPRGGSDTPVRLDKWLWAARFYRTRKLSQEAIEGGKVRYEGQRSKPSKPVQPGATLQLRQGHDEIEVVVRGLSEHRGGASEARLLYEETPRSVQARQRAAEERRQRSQAGLLDSVRPDKKQRRLLEKLKRRLIDSG